MNKGLTKDTKKHRRRGQGKKLARVQRKIQLLVEIGRLDDMDDKSVSILA